MLLPDHETEVDFLNYEAISNTVVTFLQQNRQRAITIGIHGDWGAGKSSVLKMIAASLSRDNNVACLWFNGWAFQGFDDAKTVLIEATITELCRQRSTIGKVKQLGSQLIRRVDWLKVAKHGAGLAFTLATGIPAPNHVQAIIAGLQTAIGSVKSWSPEEMEGKLTELSSIFKSAEGENVPEVIHNFRQEFSQLLEEAKIDQLVVLIDDLDRCLPPTAIATLEAIRLFLFVPKTAFVIGADEAMIEYAVRQHFPELPITSGPMPYARNYLEKLIQVPFRIPALGIQETRLYVMLLLISALVGEKHAGFELLLKKAKESLNQPWLGSGISQSQVEALDGARKNDLAAMYVLAQQIGPILAEGTKGNPRQIKRFLNALFVRHAIAEARGFGKAVNQAVLAKLMLAERFQPDFYELIARQAMVSQDGKVLELAALETTALEDGKKGKGSPKKVDSDTHLALDEWLEREWLQRWLKIEPKLSAIDLRPYVFVVRDKQALSAATELGGLQGLIEKLCGPEIAVRSVEQQVKTLTAADSQHVFSALSERVLRHGSFTSQPSGFDGLSILAKHHVRFQTELIGILGSVEPTKLGIWVVKGWNEIITQESANTKLKTLMTQWAHQDDNPLLKRTAEQALSTMPKGTS